MKLDVRKRAEATGIERAVPKRVLLDDKEMLNVVTALSNGGTIEGALKRHVPGAETAAFFRTMRKKPKWREIFEKIKPDMALAMMDDVRERAMAAVAAQPGNIGAISVLGKISNMTAKALDSGTWGDKPMIDARQVLIVKTNLDFGVVERFDAAQKSAMLENPGTAVNPRPIMQSDAGIRRIADDGQYRLGDLDDDDAEVLPAADEPSGLASCPAAERRGRW